MTAPTQPHPNAPSDWIATLADSLDRQSVLYDQLDRLSEQQGDLLEPEFADTLLRLLADRDRIIQQLVALNAESRPLVRRWNESDAPATDAQRDQIRGVLEHIEACMARITQRDAACFATLQTNRDKVANELAGASNARSAVSAYARAGSNAPRPRFQDQEG
jgi:hypothetical protein